MQIVAYKTFTKNKPIPRFIFTINESVYSRKDVARYFGKVSENNFFAFIIIKDDQKNYVKLSKDPKEIFPSNYAMHTYHRCDKFKSMRIFNKLIWKTLRPSK